MGRPGKQTRWSAPRGSRVAIVVARFNDDITYRLRDSAIKALVKAGVARAKIKVWTVPGSLEIPQVAARLARSDQPPQALIAIGCVIRGGSSHHEHVARVALDNLGRLGLTSPFPIISCVLTVEEHAQALERADGSLADRGAEAAAAALEMMSVSRKLDLES